MHELRPVGCVLAFAFSLAAQSPLTTTYAGGIGGSVGGAVFFDLNPAVALAITGIDINLNTAASTAGSIDIYSCVGTYSGNEGNIAAWTMIGTGTVTSNGPGIASTLTLAAPIPILPGLAGYCYVGVGHSFFYTNPGTFQTYSTAELTFVGGSAHNSAFTGVGLTPRIANTTISYVAAAGNVASLSSFGEGCHNKPRMVHEHFPANTLPVDLAGTSWQMIFTPNSNGGYYVIVPGGPAYDGVTAAANGTDLLLGSPSIGYGTTWDDASYIVTPGFPVPYPGVGSPVATDISVNSNAKIFFGAVTGTSFATHSSTHGSIAGFRGTTGSGLAILAAFGNDLNPTTGGSLWLETTPTSVRFTWDNILNWQHPAAGNPAAVANEIQVEVMAGGSINIAFGANLGNGGALTNDAIMGFSAGGGEPLLDPPIDWSTLAGYQSGDGSVPLTLSGDARPVIGTTVNMTIGDIPANSPFAGLIYGWVKLDPGANLTSSGMAGCFQHTDPISVLLFIAPGATASSPFNIPNDPGLSGVRIIAQGAAYNPGVIPNVLGASSSNGVELILDLN